MPRKYRPDEPIYKNQPGTVTVTVEAFQVGDPRYQRTLPDGSTITDGMPLEMLRKDFGGDDGFMLDPAKGGRHHISLKPWADADPQKTYICIKFHFVPRGRP